jgi:two-component sensor histidine kinase
MAHAIVLPHADGSISDKSTSLDELLKTILSPYAGSDQNAGRFALHGPHIVVGAQAATRFALVLHELASNSAKYGALSAAEGSVHVTWSELNGDLVMKWEERGGPKLSGTTPAKSGFGSLLSNHSIRGDFGGSLSHNWHPDGLVVDLSFPVERLRD